jgi:hypothetical protein
MAIGTPVSIGTVATSGTASLTHVLTCTAAVPSGASVFLVFTHHGAALTLAPTITDSVGGNSWSIDVGGIVNGTTMVCYIISGRITNALSVGSTITITINNARNGAVVGCYATGIATTSYLDKTNSAIVTSATNNPEVSTPSATDTADELIIVGVATTGSYTYTPAANYTKLGEASSVTTVRAAILDYRIVSATGTYAGGGTFAQTEVWSALIATYRAAASGTAYNRSISVSTAISTAAQSRDATLRRMFVTNNVATVTTERQGFMKRTTLHSTAVATSVTALKGKLAAFTIANTANSTSVARSAVMKRVYALAVASSVSTARVQSAKRTAAVVAGISTSALRTAAMKRTNAHSVASSVNVARTVQSGSQSLTRTISTSNANTVGLARALVAKRVFSNSTLHAVSVALQAQRSRALGWSQVNSTVIGRQTAQKRAQSVTAANVIIVNKSAPKQRSISLTVVHNTVTNRVAQTKRTNAHSVPILVVINNQATAQLVRSVTVSTGITTSAQRRAATKRAYALGAANTVAVLAREALRRLYAVSATNDVDVSTTAQRKRSVTLGAASNVLVGRIAQLERFAALTIAHSVSIEQATSLMRSVVLVDVESLVDALFNTELHRALTISAGVQTTTEFGAGKLRSAELVNVQSGVQFDAHLALMRELVIADVPVSFTPIMILDARSVIKGYSVGGVQGAARVLGTSKSGIVVVGVGAPINIKGTQ